MARKNRAGQLDLTDFFQDHLALIVPSSHRLSNFKSIHFREALSEEFVLMEPSTALTNRLAASAAQENCALRVRMRMQGFDVVTRLVAAGLGVAVLPIEAIAPQLASLSIRAVNLLAPWAHRTHRIATRTDSLVSPAAQAFVEELKSVSK